MTVTSQTITEGLTDLVMGVYYFLPERGEQHQRDNHGWSYQVGVPAIPVLSFTLKSRTERQVTIWYWGEHIGNDTYVCFSLKQPPKNGQPSTNPNTAARLHVRTLRGTTEARLEIKTLAGYQTKDTWTTLPEAHEALWAYILSQF